MLYNLFIILTLSSFLHSLDFKFDFSGINIILEKDSSQIMNIVYI